MGSIGAGYLANLSKSKLQRSIGIEGPFPDDKMKTLQHYAVNFRNTPLGFANIHHMPDDKLLYWREMHPVRDVSDATRLGIGTLVTILILEDQMKTHDISLDSGYDIHHGSTEEIFEERANQLRTVGITSKRTPLDEYLAKFKSYARSKGFSF